MILHPSPWLFAFLSLCTYSFWGFLNGWSSTKIDPYSGLFYSSFGYFIAGLIGLCFRQFQLQANLSGIGIGLSLGFATGLGGLFLLLAIHKLQNASLLIVLTSLYPIGTILLCAVFLNETFSFRECIGACLAIIGLILMLTKS